MEYCWGDLCLPFKWSLHTDSPSICEQQYILALTAIWLLPTEAANWQCRRGGTSSTPLNPHTPWNFLQKTLQLHCTAIASAGERSFHLYSPALPLLPHPSLCLLPSIPRSSSFTTQRSCSGVIPAGPRADHSFYFLLKKFGGPKGFLLTSIILPCHRNCVSSQFSPTRRLCTRSHSDDTATSPATWLTGDSPVPKTIHIYSSCL